MYIPFSGFVTPLQIHAQTQEDGPLSWRMLLVDQVFANSSTLELIDNQLDNQQQMNF